VAKKRRAKLMIVRDRKHWTNRLVLWVPFYGQFQLAAHPNTALFNRKVRQIVEMLGLPVEEV